MNSAIKPALPTMIPLMFLGAALLAQDATIESGISADEEIVVRGQRLSDLRAELDAARVRVYDLFNQLNNDDAFDVRCNYESSTGTRMRQQVCRPQFRTSIANSAAEAWRFALTTACPQGLTQECIFSDFAQGGMSAAQAEESREGYMQRRFELEMARVVLEHPEIREAMLDYASLERAYDNARGRDE